MSLVLSIFPGIGLMDMAFEQEGFCVVRGPDLLWGGDIKTFHPPAGKFDGVIGGPPCQAFSSLAPLNRSLGHTPKFGNLIPEFERVVAEANPEWFLMENVPAAPVLSVPGWTGRDILIDDIAVGGVTSRRRRFTFAVKLPRVVQSFSVQLVALQKQYTPERTVTGDARIASVSQQQKSKRDGDGTLPNTGTRRSLQATCELQGLPSMFFHESPFTESAKRQMLGNGVPLPMGLAIARAVKKALDGQSSPDH